MEVEYLDVLKPLESSLKNYLTRDEARSKMKLSSQEDMRYRGLSIAVCLRGTDEPVFIVKMGAFEAHFRIKDGIKVRGSIGSDDNNIARWYHRSNVKEVLTGLLGKKRTE